MRGILGWSLCRASMSVALAGLLCLSALGAADLAGELDFTKGQDAFQQGDYQAALRHFRQARKAAPDNSAYAHWEGATLLRLRKYDKALESLNEARALDGSRPLPGLSYDLGVAHYHLGNYEEAEEELTRSLREEPGNERARFFRALVYKETDRTELAIRELEQVRRESPEMGEEVSLLLGKIYAEAGDEQRAAQELRAAASAQNQRIAVLGRDYLRQIQVTRREAVRKRWSFDGYSSIEYDTNVVLNPENPGVDFPVSDSEDWRQEWWGVLRFNPIAKPRFVMGLSYGFYQTLHQDLTEFDFQGHLPRVYAIANKGKHTWVGAGGVQYFFLDSDDYLRRWEIQNSYFYRTGASGRFRLYHRYRDDNYFESPERDGHEHFFGASQTIFPWQNKARYLQFGAGWGDRDSDIDYTYNTRQADLTFFTPLGETWYFFFAFLYSHYDYEFPNTDFGVVRADSEWELATRVTYELTEHWNLIGEYRFTEHKSNIDFFDYKRHIMTVGITASY